MNVTSQTRAFLLLAALLAFLIATRLCHSGILWTDGDYHLAAAMQLHDGKALYRDLWYDKPPLTALLFDVAGRPSGWQLSVLEAVVAWIACLFAYLLAAQLAGRKAGALAASLLAFFLTFYIPSAVIPIAPDFLMIAPHLAAIYFALVRKPVWAGVCAAIAFGINTKGIFVLIACLVIAPLDAVPLIAGFALPCAAGAIALFWTGAWSGYLDQVWRWSVLYARNSPVPNPWANAFFRTLNWGGFHAALLLGGFLYFQKRTAHRLQLLIWVLISCLAVSQGMRFLPRYYLQVLAPLTVLAAIGFTAASRRWIKIAAILALLVPLVRFGPEYLTLALDDLSGRAHHWTDLALDQDDRTIASMLNHRSARSGTLFVWGYRPGIYVYTRLDAPGIFWDSQPVTGVPADRHLGSSTSIAVEWAKSNRGQLATTRPTYLVDSLSLSNPALAISRYPELRAWFSLYHECGRTRLSVIYCFQ